MAHLKSKVEVFAAIRRDSRAGLSGRQIAIKYRVSRNTVAEALRQPWPEPRKKMAPRASRLDPFKSLIDEMLRADLDAPRKQRHTAKRIFARLMDEHQAMEISYQIVRAYVAHRRGEIRVEAGRDPPEAFIPQSHLPGVEAEVDFGDVTVRIAGEQVKCFLFSFRLSYSGKAVHRVLATGGQEAFFEGHVHAFSVLGGVPTGKVRYDNLKAAVSAVLGFTGPGPSPPAGRRSASTTESRRSTAGRGSRAPTVGGGVQGPRRPRRHPRADRSAAPGPLPPHRASGHRPGRRAAGRRAHRGRGRPGGPQSR
ncbi:hypothetical protein Ssi02_69460 [Sinosporangium siamense]|uniref:HTH IS21-type domain-containing protein n=1 Tax=Sinosporangium siamense TaxID=1367973 RepID=A0A919RMX0_9ACTN|nr:hypothetical protein Ssi02_69460 [Sinosporangium siamense]